MRTTNETVCAHDNVDEYQGTCDDCGVARAPVLQPKFDPKIKGAWLPSAAEFAEQYDAEHHLAVSMLSIFESAKAEIYRQYDPYAHAKLVRIRKAAFASDFTQYSK